jgi:hypothetical protein
MKRILTLIALSVTLVPMVLHAQDYTLLRSWRTCGRYNGRYWNDIATWGPSAGAQATYLGGVMDMDVTRDMIMNLKTGRTEQHTSWPAGANIGEVQRALNQFYEDPANLQIPIISAIFFVKDRFEGVAPKDVEDKIRFERRWLVS